MLILFPILGHAQQLTGTLTGTVYDQSGAVVPSASIVLRNQASGDERAITSDDSGHFVITALQPATYSIQISATGFSGWKENDIVVNQGDNRDVANIKLQIGGNSTHVDVVSGADAVVPLDTAEVSTSLNATMIDQFPLSGRDAGELLKVVPGMALNNGNSQSSFSGRTVSSNQGPVGDFSSNGTQPNGTMAFMLDGANLVDPGNAGTQIANINQDMVASVKVLTSSYGAEYAKGPTIFQAFSKSGGSSFHGEAYLYTHNAVLDSVNSFTKAQGGNNAAQSYYYIGGNVGGPVILPFIKFNRNRKSLFFWAGYEYMKQQPAGSILNFNVPTDAQLSGNFDNSAIPAAAIAAWPNFYNEPTNNLAPGATATKVPISDFDPNICNGCNSGAATGPVRSGVLGLYPGPNETPSAANGYNNYRYANTSPQNRYEATGKLDYSLGDNTKVTGSYSFQKENDLAPISIWWSPPWTLPYPTPAASATTSKLIMINATHVFSATTTNEFVFTRIRFQNPYTLANPSVVDRTKLGFNVNGLFGSTEKQMPNFSGPWGGSLANISQFDLTSGSFEGIKTAPAVYDNFTKVVGDHALKVGAYWDTTENSQGSTAAGNGTYNIGGGSNSTGNVVADLELGRIGSYSQQSSTPIEDIKYHQWSIYGQDSWKATRQLTINLGLRADHMGQWYGLPPGFEVFDGSVYNNTSAAPANTGLEWHAIDSSIPNSGWKSPFLSMDPRVGFAYDLFGTGKTVFRGGIALFRYQASTQVGGAGTGPLGSFNYSTPNAFNGYAGIGAFTPPSSVSQNGATSNVYAMQKNDSRTPYTTDYNATISQALPWRSVFEVSYVGNRSGDEYLDGSNSNLGNLNNVAPGAFFRPDPKSGNLQSPGAPGCGSTGLNQPLLCLTNPTAYPTNFTANDYRPLTNYQNVYLVTHAGYSHYNSAQFSFQKQSGPVTFVTNYTFSKVLGSRDGVSSNGAGNGTGADPFNIVNDYGLLAYDHTHIVNLTYSWNLPKPIHNERILEGVVNGWQLSGYTAWQSGAPLQINQAQTFNATYPGNLTVPTVGHPNLPDNSITLPNGLKAVSVSPSTWFGSNAYNDLIPALSCDPLKGLRSGQQFNPNCFTTPAYGQQGPLQMPYMRNPAYFDSDLGIYKNFKITENQKLSIRGSATNFLNHPLRQYGLANNSDITLSFVQNTPATCAGCFTIGSNGTATGLQVQSLSPVNTNTTTTGKPAFTTGQRQVTLSAKYYF
ncbi:MAG TPA: TonB-dependent receptor [Acidobacteriaceae bacterium]